MKFPFFASFLVFVAWLTYEISKHSRLDAEKERSFWEKEHRANNTRRKSLDDLPYIAVPLDSLFLQLLPEDEQAAEYKETLRTLSEARIVNFTGITNTDLKLKYGAPNIDLLSRYDQSYTTLVRTLQKWAERLHQNGYPQEALRVLEFAVSTRTDVSATYRLLAELYIQAGQAEKIKALIPVAEGLNSSLSGHIAALLKERLETV